MLGLEEGREEVHHSVLSSLELVEHLALSAFVVLLHLALSALVVLLHALHAPLHLKDELEHGVVGGG